VAREQVASQPTSFFRPAASPADPSRDKRANWILPTDLAQHSELLGGRKTSVRHRMYARVPTERRINVTIHRLPAKAGTFPNGKVRGWMSSHSVRMKKKELTPQELFLVSCPTCGVPAGKCCVLNTGAPRSNPHIDRKFVALEALEKNRTEDGRS
jgi:hypothetical protein